MPIVRTSKNRPHPGLERLAEAAQREREYRERRRAERKRARRARRAPLHPNRNYDHEEDTDDE